MKYNKKKGINGNIIIIIILLYENQSVRAKEWAPERE